MTDATPDDLAMLEAHIDANPDDVDAYLIYADHLQSRGDPRGALIAMHVEAERLRPTGFVTPQMFQRVRALRRAIVVQLQRHYHAFYGPLEHCPRAVRVHWRRGFIDKLSFRMAPLKDEPPNPQLPGPLDPVPSPRSPEIATTLDDLVAFVPALLAHPSARFLRGFECLTSDRSDFSHLTQCLAEQRPMPHLRSLAFGDPFPDRCGWPCTVNLGDVDRLLANTARLDNLSLIGAFEHTRLDLPELTRFAFLCRPPPSALLSNLCDARWPRLAGLAIDLQAHSSWSAADLTALDRFLRGDNLATVRQLELWCVRPDIVDYVSDAGVPGHIESVAIYGLRTGRSDDTLSDKAARGWRLIRRLARAPNLKRLDVEVHDLDGEQIDALHRLPLATAIDDIV